MKKYLLLFLVTLLAMCSYSANAIENEEYEVIIVLHDRTGKRLARDTLFGDDIIYTERGAIKYAESCIPKKFRDTSEEYYVYNTYYLTEKTTESVYRLWYTALRDEDDYRSWSWKRIY